MYSEEYNAYYDFEQLYDHKIILDRDDYSSVSFKSNDNIYYTSHHGEYDSKLGVWLYYYQLYVKNNTVMTLKNTNNTVKYTFTSDDARDLNVIVDTTNKTISVTPVN